MSGETTQPRCVAELALQMYYPGDEQGTNEQNGPFSVRSALHGEESDILFLLAQAVVDMSEVLKVRPTQVILSVLDTIDWMDENQEEVQ